MSDTIVLQGEVLRLLRTYASTYQAARLAMDAARDAWVSDEADSGHDSYVAYQHAREGQFYAAEDLANLVIGLLGLLPGGEYEGEVA